MDSTARECHAKYVGVRILIPKGVVIGLGFRGNWPGQRQGTVEIQGEAKSVNWHWLLTISLSSVLGSTSLSSP